MRLHTERLVLRPFAERDLDALYSWHSNPQVTRYLLSDVEDRACCERRLERRIKQTEPPTEDGQAVSFAVTLGEQIHSQVIGDVMLELVSARHRCAELGYIFGPEHNGNGYATEAAHELLRFGFEEMGMHRIVAHADAEHIASQAVMRRIGMRQEAHFVDNEWLKGDWSSEVVWAILHREWRDR